MKKSLKSIILIVASFVCVLLLARFCIVKNDPTQHSSEAKKTKIVPKKKTNQKSAAALARPYKDPNDLAKEGSWKEKSEKKPHPKLTNAKDIVLRVSLKGNRVYVLKRGKPIYTMLATGGIFKHGKSLTPTGTYEIRQGRGDNFFNQGLDEGANNWVSWDPDDQNVYLFHSVPTTADGTYNLKEAQKLGKTQGSHGCIRLSVPDSRWLMKNIPVGTKVVIKNN